MTGRAKIYLWICCLRSLPIAVACLVDQDAFRLPAWEFIRGVFPMPTWGVLLLIGGCLAGAAALTQREWLARVALATSAALTICWTIGFAVAYFDGNLLSPTWVAWGLALAGKDLVVCRQPLWSPFEPLVRRVAAGETLRSGTV